MTVPQSRPSTTSAIVVRVIIAVVVLLFAAIVGAVAFPPLLVFALFCLFTMLPASVWIAFAWRRQRIMRMLGYLEQATRHNLPLPTMLVAAARSERGVLAAQLSGLQRALAQGAPVATAIEVAACGIPARTLSFIHFAEQIGRLPHVLSRLVQQHAADAHAKQKSHVFQRFYPFFMVVNVFVLINALMVFIIPKFEKIFEDFGADLPAATTALIDVARWMAGRLPGQNVAGAFYVVLLLAAWVVVWAAIRFAGDWLPVGTILWHLPIVRRIVRDRALGDMCYGLNQAIEAGIPMHVAAEHAGKMSLNPVLSARVRAWRRALDDGMPMHEGAKAAHMPDLLVGMLATARSDRDVGDVFDFLARYYGERVNATAAMIAAATEPAVVLVLGALVGALVIGLFMPMVALVWRMVELAGG